ncbi:hypothetical protein QKT49_gp180 [Acanthamoeba castellanii medusavirus]|uniref:Uncharacterized protein n=1 Tax=Acanthamoeba castellanii medusavirus J1 TaxID=3114988 RepID=A0A3T1CXM8_9VIRU|nr:hypothetical protein QKT49_gp180 [Acanthamoeba castellanii medusavirus]BBI30583.1 hypothetical protein [Acanthamoeba castellanii medusavirus J1]
MTSPYTIPHVVQAAAIEDGVGSMLLDVDDAGNVAPSPFTSVDISKRLDMVNKRLFSVWTVPPQNMIVDGPTQGIYRLGNWRVDADGSVPAQATVLTFYDKTEGGLDYETGLFSVPASGLYRHSLYTHVQTIGHTNFGIFVETNGLRHVGNFARTPEDVVFGDSAHFSTELWHDENDKIGFLCATAHTDTTINGRFAHWTVTRTYDSATFGVPREGVARRSLVA